ncbi:PEP-CTERM system histidine kinase PrsK [Oxalobacteraceae bacterium]|nr:PEP-CTERM system histidine kinase PrsK [Oxalobacteraceae bacterium]
MMLADWPAVSIAAFSYSAAALSFLGLGALLLGNWRARRHARTLLLCCGLSALWAVVAALLAQPGGLLLDALETLRTGSWLWLLLCLMGNAGLRFSAGLLSIVVLSALQLAGAELQADPDYAGAAGLTLITARLLLSVLGMLLVEQLYRGTPPRERWGIKFACLGIGGLIAYDFFLYSDALLFRQINPEIWAARGLVDALAAPLLGMSAARNPAWGAALSLSRQLMLRSAALIGAAVYLLAMALAAYYLRYVGGAWGRLMQLVSLSGAIALLAAVLFSGSSRARLKVLINKHFYQGHFDYRQEWLRFTRALSAEGPSLGQRTVQAVAELVESPAGALWIRRDGGQCEPVASWNMAAQSVLEPANGALCRFLEERQWVIDVAHCVAEPQRYGQLTLPAWLYGLPQLWLVLPLMLHGRLFGFVVLARPRTPLLLDWEVTDLLKIAGSQAASYLAHRETADSLMVARQFESFNRMSTFIVHDLKNLVAQLSLLLANAEKHKANPAFQDDMLATLANSVGKMTQMLRKLARQASGDSCAPLRLAALLEQAVAARAMQAPVPRLEVRDASLTVLANWTRLERVVGHLIQNAVEATAPDGWVDVRLLRQGKAAVIELQDSGHGMSEEFIRERLFRPFDSTKTAGMGIGVFESREYLRELGGQLEVRSAPQAGSTFRVILPALAQAAAA